MAPAHVLLHDARLLQSAALCLVLLLLAACARPASMAPISRRLAAQKRAIKAPAVPALLSKIGSTGAPASGPLAVLEVRRCVIILGTGRSGSTQLMDAVNQLPGYYIQGEQEAAFWHLYKTYESLESTWFHVKDRRQAAEQQGKEAAGQQDEAAATDLDFAATKELYDAAALKAKQPWFNDLRPARVQEAVRALYYFTYGHLGPDVVSGFKEIRFGAGRAFPPEADYRHFEEFVGFLRMLCNDVKLLLNSRSSASPESNAKLTHMLVRSRKVNNPEDFVDSLSVTHEWYDRYAREHPDHSLRVMMEDMFDAKRNGTLARRLLAFLGEDPNLPVRFDRMPGWTDPNKTSRRMADQ